MKKGKYISFSVSALALFSILSSSIAQAATYSYRNSDRYYIDTTSSVAFITVYTSPAQPYAPVYGWRDHKLSNGSHGDYGYSGEIIGYTDSTGAWSSTDDVAGVSQLFCGKYENEQYAVGSPSAPKTAKITFYITNSTDLDFGPYITSCKPSEWGF